MVQLNKWFSQAQPDVRVEAPVQIHISPEARDWLTAHGGQLTIDPPASGGG